MKIQYKHQKFQADAAKAITNLFAGQPFLTNSYLIDEGENYSLTEFTGWNNALINPRLTKQTILEHVKKQQIEQGIEPSKILEGDGFNFTIEMETGVGKTYTYIKTIYELNKLYGWSKFIIVVPSIAIREGVYKSFETTQDHFMDEYGKKIRFFVYNSSNLTQIDQFASDSSINVMIINSQAFNAKGKDARRIYMKLDEFRSRRPIDIIAKTNPILIIDEPQSVEGKQTKERLKEFNPLMTLRYSATHKSDSIYNMVYRLDAMEAYNKKLVKKIAVKGISQHGNTATDSYVYLESINLSKKAPTATIQFDQKGKSSVRQVTRVVEEGFNLYDHSNGMEEYKDNYIVSKIDGRDNSIEFLNGIKIYAGEVIGKTTEEQLRRIQIRETILSHFDRERQLFAKGIKVLSLFFIDEVDHYRQYNEAGQKQNGIFAQMFEEEYEQILNDVQLRFKDDADYLAYLNSIQPSETHAGYFSIDKKGRMVNSKLRSKKESVSDDTDAYDLIMKNKELLLERDPKKSPVRFIFSHSALREGWDNPNVFQICTLKQSSSDVRKRQEVGRGLRLCVNQDGERQDTNALGAEVHDVNVLTVIASESYDSFARGLQSELAEDLKDRPKVVDRNLFLNKVITDQEGNEQIVDAKIAGDIYFDLVSNGYIDREGNLTEKYFDHKDNGNVDLPSVEEFLNSVLNIVDSIYSPQSVLIENARNNNVELTVDHSKLAMPEFKQLWNRINSKTVYVVDFDEQELIDKSIHALDSKLRVPKIYFKVETGEMKEMDSVDKLKSGDLFVREHSRNYSTETAVSSNVKYDLVGKLVEQTGLTRKTIVRILTGIKESTFNQFKDNPEEFILRAGNLINDEKATVIIQHITYNLTDESYETDIFTEPTMKGQLGKNAMKTKKHLYDHLIYDSKNEKEFAEKLDVADEVAVYVKLPDGFYISTPVGKYNPDWAIAFNEGEVKHIYFVAETKGSMRTMDLRDVEKAKIHCAKEHFKKISSDKVIYDVVNGYDELLNIIQSN